MDSLRQNHTKTASMSITKQQKRHGIKLRARRAFEKSSGVSRRSLSARENAEAKPYRVPLRVSLYHRFSCALKCSQDYFTHTGHWNTEKLESHASVQNIDSDKM